MASATLLEHAEVSSGSPAEQILEAGKHYEVVNGQVVEEPPLGTREAILASVLDQILGPFARANRLGRVAVETLFILRHEPRLRRRPDVAFVSAERWPLNRPTTSAAAWDVIPDLAVEVVSPTDPASDVQSKIAEYFSAGVRLVWVVYPDQFEVYVYESPRVVRILGREDAVDGGAVLPGFAMAIAEVFEVEGDETTAAGP